MQILTISKASELTKSLGHPLEPRSIRAAIHRGLLPAELAGPRCLLVTEQDLRAYLARKKDKPGRKPAKAG